MARVELLGVSSAIKESEVAILTDREQDDLIQREAARLQEELNKFVSGARPHKDRPLIFHVKGPFNDPLQGRIHVHTCAGYFDLDALATESPAYQVHVLGHAGTTEGGSHLGGAM